MSGVYVQDNHSTCCSSKSVSQQISDGMNLRNSSKSLLLQQSDIKEQLRFRTPKHIHPNKPEQAQKLLPRSSCSTCPQKQRNKSFLPQLSTADEYSPEPYNQRKLKSESSITQLIEVTRQKRPELVHLKKTCPCPRQLIPLHCSSPLIKKTRADNNFNRSKIPISCKYLKPLPATSNKKQSCEQKCKVTANQLPLRLTTKKNLSSQIKEEESSTNDKSIVLEKVPHPYNNSPGELRLETTDIFINTVPPEPVTCKRQSNFYNPHYLSPIPIIRTEQCISARHRKGEFTHIPSTCRVVPIRNNPIPSLGALVIPHPFVIEQRFPPTHFSRINNMAQNQDIPQFTWNLTNSDSSDVLLEQEVSNTSSEEAKNNNIPHAVDSTSGDETTRTRPRPALTHSVSIVIDPVDNEDSDEIKVVQDVIEAEELTKDDLEEEEVYSSNPKSNEDVIQTIMDHARLRKEEFARLLEEYAQICNEINRAETGLI